MSDADENAHWRNAPNGEAVKPSKLEVGKPYLIRIHSASLRAEFVARFLGAEAQTKDVFADEGSEATGCQWLAFDNGLFFENRPGVDDSTWTVYPWFDTRERQLTVAGGVVNFQGGWISLLDQRSSGSLDHLSFYRRHWIGDSQLGSMILDMIRVAADEGLATAERYGVMRLMAGGAQVSSRGELHWREENLGEIPRRILKDLLSAGLVSERPYRLTPAGKQALAEHQALPQEDDAEEFSYDISDATEVEGKCDWCGNCVTYQDEAYSLCKNCAEQWGDAGDRS